MDEVLVYEIMSLIADNNLVAGGWDIAERCGFSGVKYFREAFCRETGMSVGVYKKMLPGVESGRQT